MHNKNRRMIYLASPYSSGFRPYDKQGNVRARPSLEERIHQTELFLHWSLHNTPDWVYSPVVYYHRLALNHSLDISHSFWQEQNEFVIRYSDAIWVLCLDDWDLSLGVQAEIRYAQQISCPVEYVTKGENNTWHVGDLPIG